MASRAVGALLRRGTNMTLNRSNAGSMSLHIAFGLAIASIGTQPATADEVRGVCPGTALGAATGSSPIPSPCTLRRGSVRIETLYYQNASKVGGTALAGYPMLQIAAGVARSVDVVFDPPSQIAESGLRGAGIFPRSHSSYGLRYRFSQTARAVFAAGFAVAPPASLYAPSQNQAKYLLDVNSAYELAPGLTIKGIVQASTSHTPGVGRVLPAQILGADLSLGPSTILTPDIGLRSVTRRAQAQSFGDLCIKHSLYRNVTFDVGLGTAFNPVARAKAHYISSGLSFKP